MTTEEMEYWLMEEYRREMFDGDDPSKVSAPPQDPPKDEDVGF